MNRRDVDEITFSEYAYETNSFISRDIKEFEDILYLYNSFEKKGDSFLTKSERNNDVQVTINHEEDILRSISILVTKCNEETTKEKLFFDAYYVLKFINENYLFMPRDNQIYNQVLEELGNSCYAWIENNKFRIYFVLMDQFTSIEITTIVK